jgi:hypothetical protein
VFGRRLAALARMSRRRTQACARLAVLGVLVVLGVLGVLGVLVNFKAREAQSLEIPNFRNLKCRNLKY